mmetsp:Transcript_8510/g.28971  ORF Transcript_8510/g.28971 Transcript_8510/m.28971 type:complete len:377 (-) Transcript_8510:45-1175(-)
MCGQCCRRRRRRRRWWPPWSRCLDVAVVQLLPTLLRKALPPAQPPPLRRRRPPLPRAVHGRGRSVGPLEAPRGGLGQLLAHGFLSDHGGTVAHHHHAQIAGGELGLHPRPQRAGVVGENAADAGGPKAVRGTDEARQRIRLGRLKVEEEVGHDERLAAALQGQQQGHLELPRARRGEQRNADGLRALLQRGGDRHVTVRLRVVHRRIGREHLGRGVRHAPGVCIEAVVGVGHDDPAHLAQGLKRGPYFGAQAHGAVNQKRAVAGPAPHGAVAAEGRTGLRHGSSHHPKVVRERSKLAVREHGLLVRGAGLGRWGAAHEQCAEEEPALEPPRGEVDERHREGHERGSHGAGNDQGFHGFGNGWASREEPLGCDAGGT